MCQTFMLCQCQGPTVFVQDCWLEWNQCNAEWWRCQRIFETVIRRPWGECIQSLGSRSSLANCLVHWWCLSVCCCNIFVMYTNFSIPAVVFLNTQKWRFCLKLQAVWNYDNLNILWALRSLQFISLYCCCVSCAGSVWCGVIWERPMYIPGVGYQLLVLWGADLHCWNHADWLGN